MVEIKALQCWAIVRMSTKLTYRNVPALDMVNEALLINHCY